MDACRVSKTPPLIEAFGHGHTRRWLLVLASVFSPFTFNKVGWLVRDKLVRGLSSEVMESVMLQSSLESMASLVVGLHVLASARWRELSRERFLTQIRNSSANSSA